MRSEERIRIPARRREKAHRPPRPGQRLLLLLLFCILFSAVFQGILQFRLRRYYEGRPTEELSPGESLPETDLIEHSPELESPSERFRLELSRLSEEQAALRRQRSRIAAREQEQQDFSGAAVSAFGEEACGFSGEPETVPEGAETHGDEGGQYRRLRRGGKYRISQKVCGAHREALLRAAGEAARIAASVKLTIYLRMRHNYAIIKKLIYAFIGEITRER